MTLSLVSELNLSEGDLLSSDHFQINISKPLATKLGFSNAMLLGYLHEVLQNPTCVIDEIPWIEVSCTDLAAGIQCLGESAIRRRIKELEAQGLLKSCRLSTKQYRQTKSYTICYDAIENIAQD